MRKPSVLIIDDEDQIVNVLTTMLQSNDYQVESAAQSNEEKIIRALDNGANDFIMKPFRTTDLLSRIKACIHHPDGATGKSNFILMSCLST